MWSLSDVQKYSVQEENIGLNIKVLAPWEAKVEEEFR